MMDEDRPSILERVGIRWSLPSVVMAVATVGVVASILVVTFVVLVSGPPSRRAEAEVVEVDAGVLPTTTRREAPPPVASSLPPDPKLVARELMDNARLDECSVRLVSRLNSEAPLFDAVIDETLTAGRSRDVVVATSFAGDPTEYNRPVRGKRHAEPVLLSQKGLYERMMGDCVRQRVEAYGPYRSPSLRDAKGPVRIVLRAGTGEAKFVSAEAGVAPQGAPVQGAPSD